MGDVVSIDTDGYLTVVGRTSDVIIRGGKNISAAAVEAEVMTHPSVAMAAAVAVPTTCSASESVSSSSPGRGRQ